MAQNSHPQRNVAEALVRALHVAPDATAIISGGESFTYRQFADRCGRLVACLKKLGCKSGDRIAILSLNSHQYIEAYVAIPAAGFVIVPLNIRNTVHEHSIVLRDAGAKVLLSDRDPGELADLVEHVVTLPEGYENGIADLEPAEFGQPLQQDAIAGIFYTGGTTGAPKGVMLSHGNLIANALQYTILSRISQDDVYLVIAPLFHASGSNSVLASIWCASKQVLMPRFDTGAALDLIEEHGVTGTLGVPTTFQTMADLQARAPRDVSTLNFICHGGAPITSAHLNAAIVAFPNADFCHTFGATEMGPLATGIRGEQELLGTERLGTCGPPLIGVQVKIVDANDRPTPQGAVGEVCVKGENVMQGYWNKPEQTAQALRDGFYYTGDLGYADEAGNIYLVDRSKDMIISGGENVYSTEVEDVLTQHPCVVEAAVIGLEDAHWGEKVHAVVVLNSDLDTADLTEFCRQKLSNYKLPKSYSVNDRPLPKTGAGKIMKNALRDRLAPTTQPSLKGENDRDRPPCPLPRDGRA